MLELITTAILSFCYIKSCVDENIKEENLREEKRIRDIKISVFCYAVAKKILYNNVIKQLQDRKITLEEINKFNLNS